MKKPNILLFLTDDHGPWTLPEYGNSELCLPHLSRLAAEGTLFRNAFTPSPVCSPARACLLTGRTPSQVGIHDWLEESDPAIARRDWLADEVTLPELLRASGYHTILSGKWHLGQSHQTPRGFDRCFGLGGWQGIHHGPYTYHQDGLPMELDGNKSANITARALDMLREAPADRPFFLNVGYIATHSPYNAEAHDPSLVEQTREFRFSDIPRCASHPWAKNEGMGKSDEQNEEAILSRSRGYYAAVLELDANVGRILAWLEEHDPHRETLVVYASDHGCSLGHHGFWGKGNSTRPLNMYEVSLRVPLIVRGPGIPAGQVVESPVDHYDLFQALCEWAGAEREGIIPKHRNYPGRSLVPLAQGKPVAGWPVERYGEYGDLRMIRTSEYKFVKRYPGGPNELFALREDPGEMRNLADEPSHLSIRQGMEELLETWYETHQDPAKSGLRVKFLPAHNLDSEAWRDGRRDSAPKKAERA